MKLSRLGYSIAAIALIIATFLPLPALAAVPTAAIAADNSGNSFVSKAVEQVGSAVVRIDTERTITRRLDPFFGDEALTGLPQQQLLRGQGSGFIIDRDGVILTNAHVVDRADKVTVILKDGRSFKGKVRGVDAVTDLAVIQVSGAKNLPVAELGDSDIVKVGDWAIAVGNPFGLDNTVTLGIVSTLKRASSTVGMTDKRLDFIQTDAAINPGNSGGPLLNGKGEVIGINTAIRADAIGIGFAIPINKAKTISTQLARGEKVSHPYLGVQMVTLTPEIAAENNNDPNALFQIPPVNGVLVVKVLPNTAASVAGMRRGDTILEVDGEAIHDANQLQNVMENSRVSQLLQVRILRDGKDRIVKVIPKDLIDEQN
ncbi:HhoA/HhoB/HtrA family serine endopeptidase [Chamaesiphon minutus]|uniref:Trypsin-like serine protease with C-terminal PDZ domain n=1 Tax=Chamaesiphon minutus (strain ATCC 27169 / PCC 6605) TaxID=1173020 RepID=K9UK49_CHAP6|nr:HhoA/HhoB/HtrA family serine endopeptidase [Chamaesiphon minutus]AFY94796.1 trypsin-like serine protease with C-terminal PDZ domain [Chamaesiphon minutus PCC 6605]